MEKERHTQRERDRRSRETSETDGEMETHPETKSDAGKSQPQRAAGTETARETEAADGRGDEQSPAAAGPARAGEGPAATCA